MPVRAASRRALLALSIGLLAAGVAARATEAREYFVPLDDYRELPPECYEPNLIRPREIILHWDGNRHGRELWVTAITFETLRLLGDSAHFAVDYKRTWHMLPMLTSRVQESHGAQGYNRVAINVEMAGTEFDLPDNYLPEGEIERTVTLVSRLMDRYGIAIEHVVGHFERDPRGAKRDPGERFVGDFRGRLAGYRAGLSPLKRQRLAEP